MQQNAAWSHITLLTHTAYFTKIRKRTPPLAQENTRRFASTAQTQWNDYTKKKKKAAHCTHSLGRRRFDIQRLIRNDAVLTAL